MRETFAEQPNPLSMSTSSTSPTPAIPPTPMTLQAIYTRVRDHLLKQGAKALSDECVYDCLYRAPGGLKCAVGCLIPDDEYRADMEGASIGSCTPTAVWVRGALYRAGVIPAEAVPNAEHCSVALMSRLQTVHDAHPVRVWPERLALVATQYGLTP